VLRKTARGKKVSFFKTKTELFGTFCGHLVYFSRFGKLCRKKSGIPATAEVLNVSDKSPKRQKTAETAGKNVGQQLKPAVG
jgi:hypothetical protein